MWLKLYILIVVLSVIIVLQYAQFGIKYLNKIYDIENKYFIPISCVSNSICGLSGMILFFLIIFMIVPLETFENITSILNPQQLHKLPDNLNNGMSSIYKNVR